MKWGWLARRGQASRQSGIGRERCLGAARCCANVRESGRPAPESDRDQRIMSPVSIMPMRVEGHQPEK